MIEMKMENEIDLKQKRAILYLPENCVELKATCKVFEDGHLIEVETIFDFKALRQAFSDADRNYINDDDHFVITSKGLAWLDELQKIKTENDAAAIEEENMPKSTIEYYG